MGAVHSNGYISGIFCFVVFTVLFLAELFVLLLFKFLRGFIGAGYLTFHCFPVSKKTGLKKGRKGFFPFAWRRRYVKMSGVKKIIIFGCKQKKTVVL